jgi:cysteinyl-tRNA synthetase
LGNFYTIDDVLNRGFHPLALRLLFLTAHYQSEMNFTLVNLAGSQKSYEKLLKQFAELGQEKSGDHEVSNSYDKTIEYKKQFFEAIANNLNTPQAVSVMWSLLKDEGVLPSDKKLALIEFDEILGLKLIDAEEILNDMAENRLVEENDLPAEIQELVVERAEARKNKDFKESDRIRDILLEKGYQVKDSADGQEIKK